LYFGFIFIAKSLIMNNLSLALCSAALQKQQLQYFYTPSPPSLLCFRFFACVFASAFLHVSLLPLFCMCLCFRFFACVFADATRKRRTEQTTLQMLHVSEEAEQTTLQLHSKRL
jgi:hypothetical protein